MIRVPPTLMFALASTVPFAALSIAVCFHLFSDTHTIMGLLLTYAVVIISFLGGIHLGVAVTHRYQNKWILNLLIVESIWPSLIAWGLLYMAPQHIQLLVLTLLYALMLAIDSLLYNNDLVPQWFFNLRCIITPIVVVSLYVAYFAII